MKIKENTEKKRISKVTVGIIAVILALVLIISMLYGFVIYPQTYVAKIGSEVITTQEYKFLLQQTMGSMLTMVGLQPGQNPENEQAFWQATDAEGNSYYAIAKSQALERSIDIKVQIQQAAKEGIRLDSEDKKKVQEVVDNYSGGDRSAFRKALKQQLDMGLGEYIDIMEELFLTEKLNERISADIEIPDTDIEAAYEENIDQFKSVTVRHILVLVDDMNDEEAKNEKMKTAEEILDRVNKGEDMEALAEELSEDPGVTENKGLYSFRIDGSDVNGSSRYVQEFPDWAYDNKEVGDTGIVETSYGLHVMKLLEINEQGLDEVRDSIESYLKGQKYEEKLLEWRDEYTFKLNEDVFQETN